jgi:hypothetical protein
MINCPRVDGYVFKDTALPKFKEKKVKKCMGGVGLKVSGGEQGKKICHRQ